MDYFVNKEEQYTVLRPEFEKLDSTIAPEMKSTIVSLMTEGVQNIIFDMSEIKYVDSSGLSALLIGNRMLKEVNGMFVVTNVCEHAGKLLKISRLDTVLSVSVNVPEAIDTIFLNELEKDLNNSNF